MDSDSIYTREAMRALLQVTRAPVLSLYVLADPDVGLPPEVVEAHRGGVIRLDTGPGLYRPVAAACLLDCLEIMGLSFAGKAGTYQIPWWAVVFVDVAEGGRTQRYYLKPLLVKQEGEPTPPSPEPVSGGKVIKVDFRRKTVDRGGRGGLRSSLAVHGDGS